MSNDTLTEKKIVPKKKKTNNQKNSAENKKVNNRKQSAESKPLKLQHRQFINYYTNIDNKETFGNGTQSYLATYPNADYSTATVNASKLLSKTSIRSEIELLVEQMNLGNQVRLQTIKQIILSQTSQKTVTKATDKDGNTYETVVERPPTATERLKAIDLLAKLDGTYDKNRVKADIMSSELKSIIKKHKKELD